MGVRGICSYIVDHPELGRVEVTGKEAARRITARWKDGTVCVTVPVGLTRNGLLAALDRMAPRLLKHRNVLRFAIGDVISLDGLSIRIGIQRIRPDGVLYKAALPESSVEVGETVDLSSLAATRLISRAMAAIAHRLAFQILVPRAMELAVRTKCAPSSWRISTGKKVLGKCDTNGVISLSYMNLFLPMELRDYIVCHELAHLSEMNHSSRFHAVCDGYCNGREKALARKLRAYKWPLLK